MDIDKIKKQLEREQKKQREAARKSQALGAKLSAAERKAADRRKILDGLAAQHGCVQSEEYRRLHERFREEAIYYARDRALFGLAPLSEAEIAERSVWFGKIGGKRIEDADAATLPDGSAASASRLETTQAEERETEAA